MQDLRKSRSVKSLLWNVHKSDFTSWGNFFRSAVFGWFTFILLVTGISLILSFRIDYLPPDIQVGRVAPKDIKSDRNYEIIDVYNTEANRQAAYKSLLPVYDYDSNVAAETDQKIKAAFLQARQSIERHESPEKIADMFQASLGVSLSPAQLKLLAEDGYSASSEMTLRRLIHRAMGQKIMAGREGLEAEGSGGIMLRSVRQEPPNNEARLEDFREIKSLEGVRNELESMAREQTQENAEGLSVAQLAPIADLLLRPNTNFNSVETELRRARIVGSVPNVIIKVQAGESIIRGGDRYEPYHLTILEGIRKQKSETNFIVKMIGTTLFVSLLLLITFIFSKKYIRKFDPSQEDLYFLGGVLILLLLCVRLAAALSSGLQDIVPFGVSVQALYYAIPVAGGAMLTRFILNSEISLVFAIVASALTGMFLEAHLDLSIYYLISGIVAAAAVGHVDRRSAILRAGLIVGSVNAVVIVAINLITVVSVTDAVNVTNVLINAMMGFMGGIFSSMFVLVLSPVAELLFNYVTDIKLLELGNLNHPLMQEMIMKAPGTYHHSQLVAVLAEAAAAAIGANPLLARVGSYFHDIGKMRKPSYFIENMQGGVNRHDKLSPSMSALIIASHVKDGLELAKEYNLPSRIADFIPQHQGTKLITFFYNKALEMSEDKDAPVDDKLYRYAGPRPQTREAGIILLSDGVEAGVRSIPEKTPQKIQAKVQQIINKNFGEEQLDECDITLRDLHRIAETFTRVLIGIYHQRIEYPDIEDKKATVTPIKGGKVIKVK
jgi:putative nucleotidyltransferase with HDIG domain